MKRRRALGHWPTIDEQEEVFGSRALAAIQILRGAASYVGIAGEQPEAPAYVDPEALRHQAAYQDQRRQARERRAARLERERQAQERREAVRRERLAIVNGQKICPSCGVVWRTLVGDPDAAFFCLHCHTWCHVVGHVWQRLDLDTVTAESRAALATAQRAWMAQDTPRHRIRASGPGTGVPREDGQTRNGQIFQIELQREGIWYRDSIGYSSFWAAQQALEQWVNRS